MTTNAPTSQKRTGCTDYRPTYIPLGIDERGAHQVWSRKTNTVHVVHPDGSRGRRLLDGGDIDDYVDAVADAHGWAFQKYGLNIVDHLAQVLDA